MLQIDQHEMAGRTRHRRERPRRNRILLRNLCHWTMQLELVQHRSFPFHGFRFHRIWKLVPRWNYSMGARSASLVPAVKPRPCCSVLRRARHPAAVGPESKKYPRVNKSRTSEVRKHGCVLCSSPGQTSTEPTTSLRCREQC